METLERVTQILSQVPGALLENARFGRSDFVLFWVNAEKLEECALALKSKAGFDFLENLSAVQVDEGLVFSYFVRNTKTGELLILRASLEIKGSEWIELGSVASAWPMARTFEDEISSLFGVKIPGRKNQSEWNGFPLRKSFAIDGGMSP